MESFKDTPVCMFVDANAWLDWLAKNHDKVPAVFAKIAKKGAPAKTATYEELREGALIYGWIDGITYSVDAEFYVIRFTPRRPKGKWSRINRDIVEGLMAAGKMKPSGLVQVEAAKADGRWEAAYEGQATIQVPEDLQKELDKHPKAKAFFETINKANRYAFLHRIHNASAQTRTKHIQKTIDMLNDGKLYHP